MRKIIGTITLFCFILAGCMPNPMLRNNQITNFNNLTNAPIPLHVFIIEENKTIIQDSDNLYNQNANVYLTCDKKLVPGGVKFFENTGIFLGGLISFGIIFFLLKSMKSKQISIAKIPANEILDLGAKFEIIDDSAKYETKENFIQACGKMPDTYFVVINLYGLNNFSIQTGTPGGSYTSTMSGSPYITTTTTHYSSTSDYNIYTDLYAAVFSLDVYKTSNNKIINLYHAQEIFYPNKINKYEIETIYGSKKIKYDFESKDAVDARRKNHLIQNLKKFLNGEKEAEYKNEKVDNIKVGK
jgi:hypothetical protein